MAERLEPFTEALLMRAIFALMALTALTGSTDRISAMVTVAAGPNAGGYVLRSPDVPCEITTHNPPLPKHQLDVTLGVPRPSNDPQTLTLLMLIVPNANVKGANGAFFASITFGDVSRGTRYTVESRPGHAADGSGTVAIVTRGQDATVTFDVTTARGTAYKGPIQCTDVSRY